MSNENEKLAELIKKYSCRKSQNFKEIKDLGIYEAFSSFHLIPNLKKNNPLNMTEMFCLIFRVAGKEIKECASLLNISEESIRTLEQRMRQKLKAKNRANAFYLSLINGYISFIC